MKLSRPSVAHAALAAAGTALLLWQVHATAQGSSAGVTITSSDCTAAKVGTSVEPSAIGERVRAVTLAEPSWVEAANNVPAYCRVNGIIAPVDTSPTARPINFSVVLPASWTRRAAQLGGGGMNGVIPNLTADAG